MKHLNANLDNTTNVEVETIATTRFLGLDENNNVIEISDTGIIIGDGDEDIVPPDGTFTSGDDFCFTVPRGIEALDPCYVVGGVVTLTPVPGNGDSMEVNIDTITEMSGAGVSPTADCDGLVSGETIVGSRVYWEWEVVSQTVNTFGDDYLDYDWEYPNGVVQWARQNVTLGEILPDGTVIPSTTGSTINLHVGARFYGRFGNYAQSRTRANDIAVGETVSFTSGFEEGTLTLRKVRRLIVHPDPQTYYYHAKGAGNSHTIITQNVIYPGLSGTVLGNSLGTINHLGTHTLQFGWFPSTPTFDAAFAAGGTNLTRFSFEDISTNLGSSIVLSDGTTFTSDGVNLLNGADNFCDGSYNPAGRTATLSTEICVTVLRVDAADGGLSFTVSGATAGDYRFVPTCTVEDAGGSVCPCPDDGAGDGDGDITTDGGDVSTKECVEFLYSTSNDNIQFFFGDGDNERSSSGNFNAGSPSVIPYYELRINASSLPTLQGLTTSSVQVPVTPGRITIAGVNASEGIGSVTIDYASASINGSIVTLGGLITGTTQANITAADGMGNWGNQGTVRVCTSSAGSVDVGDDLNVDGDTNVNGALCLGGSVVSFGFLDANFASRVIANRDHRGTSIPVLVSFSFSLDLIPDSEDGNLIAFRNLANQTYGYYMYTASTRLLTRVSGNLVTPDLNQTIDVFYGGSCAIDGDLNVPGSIVFNDGTTQDTAATGITINPTDGTIPVRSNATTFIDSPIRATVGGATVTGELTVTEGITRTGDQATGDTSTPVPSTTGVQFWSGTQAQYDALVAASEINDNTIYYTT